MAQHIPIKTALAILGLFALFSIAGTYFALTRPGGSPLISGFATGTTTVNVSETVTVSMVTSTVSFGNQSAGATNQTEYGLSNTPQPFVINNTGNVWENITAGAGNLFTSTVAGNPSPYYRMNSTQNTSGTFNGSCVGTGCGNSSGGSFNISWLSVPPTASASLIAAGVNFANSSRSINIYINITVPSDESAGNKTSTITFTASRY